MQVRQKHFGSISGKEIKQFVLENDNGMKVKILDYGATITSIGLPSNDGLVEVVCGFDSFEGYFSDEYKSNNPYFGCVIGRNANRIKNGQFNIGGKQYQLTLNNNKNHLHGGSKGFDKRIWLSKSFQAPNSIGLELELNSKHLDEGYPGNIQVKIVYELNNQNELHMNYYAGTDEITPLALTNHTYFNLSGFSEDIKSHKTRIYSESYLVKDSSDCVDGSIANVTEALDYSTQKPFSEAFKNMELGIDHYYVLSKTQLISEKVADFEHSKSGRRLEVYTTEPGMQVYTGYHISSRLSRENGDRYGPFSAFCCETQRYPNGVNIEGSQGSFTTPDKPFESKTIYKFNWSKDE